jgi:hypothetical protein
MDPECITFFHHAVVPTGLIIIIFLKWDTEKQKKNFCFSLLCAVLISAFYYKYVVLSD